MRVSNCICGRRWCQSGCPVIPPSPPLIPRCRELAALLWPSLSAQRPHTGRSAAPDQMSVCECKCERRAPDTIKKKKKEPNVGHVARGDGRTDIGPPASCCFCCRFHSFLTGRQDGGGGLEWVGGEGAYSTVHLCGVTERDRRGRRRGQQVRRADEEPADWR